MKWKEQWINRSSQLWKALGRYKWVLLVIVVGIILLLLPSGTSSERTAGEQTSSQGPITFDLEELEKRYAEALSEIAGAGEVTLVLSVKTGTRQVLAEDNKYAQKDNGVEETTQTVILSRGSGMQETVTLQEIYPQFQGAVIVCDGGDDPAVRLKLTEATAALTGLGADKISISSRGK